MNAPPLTPDERRDRLIFYPVAIVAGVFCLTVLMTIASAFGDPRAPVGKWLNHHATELLLWETGLLVVVALLAMTIDRIRTLRRLERERQQVAAESVDPPAADAGDSHVG